METINVFYDFQIMLMQRFGGISRYYYELLGKINERGLAHADAFCLFNQNEYFESYFHRPRGIMRCIPGKGRINKLAMPYKSKNYDIIHPTYYDNYVLRKKKNCKVVVTVYDMIQELFTGELAPGDAERTIADKKGMIYGSDHIIAISESTKNDILRIYPDIPKSKITVIYIGSNMSGTATKKHESEFLPDKFMLFVGRRRGYKNFSGFAKAVVPLLLEDRALHLVCMGGGKFTEDEKTFFSAVSGQVHQFDTCDDRLAAAYKKAECFIFPSLYEGFGIPTLEAFYCECPVILSNTSSMPEVGGDAAVYVDPYDPVDMEQKIRMVLNDEEMRMHLIEKGLNRVGMFGWDRIAEQTVECYRSVLRT